MEIKEFVENVANQFEDTDPAEITATTKLKDLEEWSSLTALAIIGMVDEEYDVTLKGDDLKNASTIQDLFQLVKDKAE